MLIKIFISIISFAVLVGVQPAYALAGVPPPPPSSCSPNCTIARSSVNGGNDGVNYQCLADVYGSSVCGMWCWAHRLSSTKDEGRDAGGGKCTCKYKSTVELFQKEGGSPNFPHQGNAAEMENAKKLCARQGGEAVMEEKKILGRYISSCKNYCKALASSAAPSVYSIGVVSPKDIYCQSVHGKNYKEALDVADFEFMLDSKNIVVAVNYCCKSDNAQAVNRTRASSDPDFNFQIPIPGLRLQPEATSDSNVTLCKDTSGAYECGGMTAYIAAVYRWGVGFASIIALLVFIYGGLLWLTSRGNSTQTGDAQKVMINAIIGLVIAIGSYVFLWTINPRLVKPSALTVKKINELDIWFKPPDTGTADLTKLEQTEYCKKFLKPEPPAGGGVPPVPATSEPAIPAVPRSGAPVPY